jgi:hypothetical protein
MPQTENPELDAQEPETGTPEAQEDNLKLGELGPFDYSAQPFLELSDDEKNAIKSLIRDCAKRDTAARRMEVEQAWEARLFKRGYQYLLPRRGGGWYLPSPTTGFGAGRQIQQAALYETNIYGAHCDIITSALVRDIPECRFEPFNPSYDPDITAADAAEDFAEIFSRSNDLRSLHTQAADYMCTDGRVLFYTRMVLDGQRFGFEDPDDDNPVVPEDETTGAPESPNTDEGQEEAQELNDSPLGDNNDGDDAGASEIPKATRKPRAREITSVFGKLEHKVPIQTNDISEMDFVFAFRDMHVSRAKGMYSWVADDIFPNGARGKNGTIKAGGGLPELELDRIARINCALALPGTYVTGDTFNQDTTEYHCWLRPSLFMEIKNDNGLRDSIMAKCRDGILAVYCGDTFCFARNESIDDHLHVLQCFPGSGQNRIALMSKVLSLQKRLNNWLDLLNDYFIKCVPRRWYPEPMIDVAALQQQGNTPGDSSPYQFQQGVEMKNAIVVEDAPQPNPMLWDVVKSFFADFPEMLSGALPSLFGAESNTDTVGGIQMQRDQALGRLSSPWGALQTATAVYFRQAVGCAAACREKLGQMTLSQSVKGKTITVDASALKGKVLCFPETDSNFPETWIQKSSRMQQFWAEAANNPASQKLISLPKNMKLLKDGIGLTDLDIPEAASVDKQLGEFEILLKTGPQPNPAISQAQEQLRQHASDAEKEGEQAKQQFEQLMPQAEAAIKALPPEVSTIAVMQDASEDHSTEADTCMEWLISPEGRKYKRGTEEERAAWANVHLHWTEHDVMAKKLAPSPPTKPPSESVSAAVDKMPPALAAQLLGKFYGIDANQKDFEQQDATETEQEITEKAADFGHGVIPPAGEKAPANSGAV